MDNQTERSTGQPRRVANYLLAWHNAEENGGWDPIDLWNVDDTVADDMLFALALIRQRHTYAEELGFRSQMQGCGNNGAARGFESTCLSIRGE